MLAMFWRSGVTTGFNFKKKKGKSKAEAITKGKTQTYIHKEDEVNKTGKTNQDRQRMEGGREKKNEGKQGRSPNTIRDKLGEIIEKQPKTQEMSNWNQ